MLRSILLAGLAAALLSGCDTGNTCSGSLCDLGVGDSGTTDTSSTTDAGPLDAGPLDARADAGDTDLGADAGFGGQCEGDFIVDSESGLAALSLCDVILGELWIRSFGGVRAELPRLRSAGAIRVTARSMRTASFPALERVAAELAIDSTDLVTLEAPALTQAGALRLTNNALLSDVETSTRAIVGSLDLARNPSLSDTNWLGNIAQLGQIRIVDMPFTDLSAFSGITNFVGTLELDSNAALFELSGLALSASLGSIMLTNNSGLADLSALSAVTNTSSITVENNASLSDLSALQNVSVIDGTLRVANNAALDALGLTDLRRVSQNITVRSNINLPTCLAIDLILQVETLGSLGGEGAFSDNRNDCTCSGPVGTATATCP